MTQRLDVALVARGLARSRAQAADLIARGRVRVEGRPARKASEPVGPGQHVEADADPYVSRAAHKLLGALDAARIAVGGRALDAGASTGGFTQVLLERGCAPVYAVDVGHGQLAAPVASDPRVVAREGLNLRDLTLADLDGEPVDVVVADVSFISLTLLVAPLLAVLRPTGVAVLMVKPQFEVGRAALDSQGVVADPAAAVGAVQPVVDAAAALGWACVWQGASTLPGERGNREFFVVLRAGSGTVGGAG
ncbi:TlyA family RNA methyltransferase [Propioniciclava soli]|uniref:TlyA family RNA methyltransferase n=1 Tax=Propioniciclava soli TaxID=2775081 RepID=A0ABZ3CAJ5_9ACTN